MSTEIQMSDPVLVREPDGSIKLPQFRFLGFNETRARRRVAAARVEIIPSLLNQENDPPFWLWMTRRDVEKNIKEWGEHPELLKALAGYAGQNTEASNTGLSQSTE